MTGIGRTVQRVLWVIGVAIAAGVVWAWQRDRSSGLPASPEWPPLREPTPVTPWVAPGEDGGCPLTHPVKANNKSRIYHLPDGRFYARTRAERCYATAHDAERDGYRGAKT